MYIYIYIFVISCLVVTFFSPSFILKKKTQFNFCDETLNCDKYYWSHQSCRDTIRYHKIK